jgi:predicted O-methyltransferase YrrM
MPELAVIVPTRGRPENIRRLISAWDFTNAWDSADLVLVADSDDPEIQGYRDVVELTRHPDTEECLVRLIEMAAWMPMVHKLNMVAKDVAEGWGTEAPPFALGFAGDDHVPQTIGWAARYLAVLHELGSGMVYGDDGYQGRKLSTEWAITADVVRRLGQMVPAPVEHMYCDNSMMDLFNGAGALRHLPEVRIEHIHPITGKTQTDAQYQRVNHRDQFRTDRLAYEAWKRTGLAADVAAVRALRPDAPEFQVVPPRPVAPAEPRMRRTATRPRSAPSSERTNRMSRFPFSQEFKHVRGATPDEIGMALADFATMVPADREIVELGVFNGRTALILAWGAGQGEGAHVTAVDPWDTEGNVYSPPFTDAESRVWADYWVRTLGYEDRISLVQGFSQDVGADWAGPPVGLLFVDGDHTKEGARRDIETWAPHLAPGARIAVDDYHHPDWPGVHEAVDELVAEGFLAPVEVYHDRLAVTRLADPDRATVTAITSVGVSPSPYPAVGGQVADDPVTVPHVETTLVREPEVVNLPEPDSEVSNQEPPLRATVHEGELEGVAEGTPVADLTLPQIKALAKVREIVLGVRKDKKAEAIQAIIEGK